MASGLLTGYKFLGCFWLFHCQEPSNYIHHESCVSLPSPWSYSNSAGLWCTGWVINIIIYACSMYVPLTRCLCWIGLSNPCALTLCQTGTTCKVTRGKAECVELPDLQDLLDQNLCAKVDLVCPIAGSSCRVVNGEPTCVPPRGAKNPCDDAPCGPATGTVCLAINGEAVCVPNTVG